MRKFQKPRRHARPLHGARVVAVQWKSRRKFKTHTHIHTPLAGGSVALSGKTQGGLWRGEGRTRKEGRETRSRNTESKTADGRQPGVTKGAERKGRAGGGSTIKRGEIQGAYEGWEGLGIVPYAHAGGWKEGKRPGGRETRRADAQEREKNADFKEDNDLCLR